MKGFGYQSDDIKLKEVRILIELLKTNSVRELARQQGTTAGNISKKIKSLELKLGLNLIERSQQGVKATAEAHAILPHLKKLDELHSHLSGELENQLAHDELLQVASTSFISSHLLPPVLAQFAKKRPNFRFRIIDLQPNLFIPAALRGGFQVCVHVGDLDWPKTWSSIKVGDLHWELYCAKKHQLGERPTQKQILNYPFVAPVYWSQEGLRFGDDLCPVSFKLRQRGHETSTAATAAHVVAHTDHLGFLPRLVVRDHLKRRELRQLQVKDWKKPVGQPMFLSVKNDYVKQSTFESLAQLLGQEFI